MKTVYGALGFVALGLAAMFSIWLVDRTMDQPKAFHPKVLAPPLAVEAPPIHEVRMRTVWKYKIDPNSVAGDTFRMKLRVPKGALPLCVMMQGDECYVWMDVDPKAELDDLTLHSVGTGHGAYTGLRYLGSVVQGVFVWHIFY